MPSIIGSSEARKKLANVLNEVAYGNQRYIVERHGQAMAAIIPADEYNTLITLLSESGVESVIDDIPVKIRFDGERYFISDDAFDLYSEGSTLETAKQDYRLALQDYLADLEADADRLAPYLVERLARLREILDSAA